MVRTFPALSKGTGFSATCAPALAPAASRAITSSAARIVRVSTMGGLLEGRGTDARPRHPGTYVIRRSHARWPSGPGTPLHVEDGAPPAARTDQPFPTPRVAQPEGTTPHSARGHPHPAPRTHRRLPG